MRGMEAGHYLLALLQLLCDVVWSSTLRKFTLSYAWAYGSGIVGGKEAKKHSRPYMASLQTHGSHRCGGMLIRKDFVLTSAHCLEPLQVVLGAHDLTKNERKRQTFEVAHYHCHENYTNQFKFDIMLLKLNGTAKLNKDVNIIKLQEDKKDIEANTECSVAGWGMTKSNTSAVATLMEVSVKTKKVQDCKCWWGEHFDIEQMICTDTTKGKGFCQGDSGGPLVCNKMALGIVAYNYAANCEDDKLPHVYMKIPFFTRWIEDVMNG